MSRPTTFQDAVEQYLQSRHDASPKTRNNHRYRLEHFLSWVEQSNVEAPRDLVGYHLEQYKQYRREVSECSLVTLRNNCWTLKCFLRWCGNIELIDPALEEKLIVPNIDNEDEARDEMITHERARDIIDYLQQYEFATRPHIIFHTLYHGGMRRSGLRALDVADWDPEARSLSLRHRPETGTQLKGGREAERDIAITDDDLVEALTAWVEDRRPRVTDDHGRTPLIASQHGRLHYQSITKICYRVTRPCWYGDGCPHDKRPESCEYTTYESYSRCPSARSAHPVRRSAITNHLRQDVPKELVSERMSVSPDVLDQHYDERGMAEKRESRRSELEDKDL